VRRGARRVRAHAAAREMHACTPGGVASP
jgi:hypothetical protein